MAVLTTASQMGYLTPETFSAIMALLSAAGLATLRAGIKNG